MRFPLLITFAGAIFCASGFVASSSQEVEQRLEQATLPTASLRVEAPAVTPGKGLSTAALEKAIADALRVLDPALSAQAKILGVPIEDRRTLIFPGLPIGFSTLLQTRGLPDPGPDVSATDPRVRSMDAQPLIERRIGPGNFLPVRFLEGGVISARAVGRVAVQFEPLPEAGLGTGFMVSPTLFLTNNHVISSPQVAASLEIQFNYQYSLDGSSILPHVIYELDPTGFFDTNVALDFTLVRVKPRSVVPAEPGANASSRTAGTEFGFIQLTDKYVYTKGQLANVIQHPEGRPKEIALHDNQIDSVYANVVRYTTDTETGSSGSPVFNNSWKVIALHHAAGEKDEAGAWKNNEGIRLDRILQYMRSKYKPEILKELGI